MANEQQFVVFRLSVEEYAIPIFDVREIIQYSGVTKVPDVPSHIEGIINLRGSVIPVVNLAGRFGQSLKLSDDTKIIIIDCGEQKVGIMVSEVTEVLSLAEHQIEPTPNVIKYNEYIRGIGKIEDRLLILLSLQNMFSQQELEDLKKAC